MYARGMRGLRWLLAGTLGIASPVALVSCLGEVLELAPTPDAGTGGAIGDGADTSLGGSGGTGSSTGGSTGDAASDAEAEPDTDAADGCAKDCLGGTCVGHKCQPVVVAPWTDSTTLPTGLAVDPAANGGVFFTSYLSASIKRAEKDGSKTSVIAQFAANERTVDLALDGHELHVTTFWDSGNTNVYSLHDDGSGKQALGDKALFGPWHIAFDATFVYWTTQYDKELVVRAPKAGGPRETLYQVSDAGSEGVWGLRVDADAAYFTPFSGNAGTLQKWLKGTQTKLASTGVTLDLALDSSFAYWCDGAGIHRVKKDGSGTTEDLAPQHALRIGIDGGYVYWTEFGTPPAHDGALRRSKLDGKKIVETLVEGLAGPYSLAFDDVAVYYAEQQAGTVSKLAK